MQSNTDNRLVWAVQLMLRMLLTCIILQSTILSAQCTLSCPGGLNLSIAGPNYDCTSVLTPVDIGVIAPSCSGLIDLDLYTSANQVLPGDVSSLGARIGIVTSSQIGLQLRARVTHRATGNYCDVLLTIVDGLSPQLTLVDTTVSILQDLLPEGAGGQFDAISIEDCTSTTQFYTDSLVQQGCGNTAYAKTFRTWTVTDTYGNSSTASQQISQIAVHLDSIHAPKDTVVSCVDGIPMGLEMGLPIVQFNGGSYELPGLSGSRDNLFWSYTDESFSGGGGTAQLLRSFRFYDACAPAVAGQNPRDLVQRISVVDTTRPIIESLNDTLFYSTSTTNCEANVTLPALTITDDCTATLAVRVQLNGQFISSNGGFFGPLSLGSYPVIYTATDSSNNSTSYPLIAVVRDQNPPVLIAKSEIQVSLSSNGEVSVTPDLFDLGSYDDCTPIQWSIRLLNTLNWENSIEVSCDNLNAITQVEIRACDQFGNCNIRQSSVVAFDYLAPQIVAPNNLDLDCSVSDTNLMAFGDVSVFDNCLFLLKDSVSINRDQCGVGKVERFWTAVDSSGNSSTAMQVISFLQSSTFSESNITWPRDTFLSKCDVVDPVNLPAGVGTPFWESVACSDVAMSHVDQRIAGPSGVCEVIFRTWTLIDQCVFDGLSRGRWQHTQLIRLVDTIPPTISVTSDSIKVYASVDSCTGGFLNEGTFSVIDCSGVSSSIQFLNSGLIVNELNFIDSSYFVSDIVDRIKLVSIDDCGNSDSVFVHIEIIDSIPPLASCIDTVNFYLSPDSSISFDPHFIDLNSQDACGDDIARYSTNFNPSCNELGWGRAELVVTDSAGLQASCFTEVQVLDTSNVCALESTVVIGKMTTVNNHPIPTRFDLVGQLGDTISTIHSAADGSFAFSVNLLDSVTIIPSSNYAPPLFISTYDLYLIGRHILGINEFTDPLKAFAGDANRSRTVSAFDMTLFRRVLLELSEKLPHGTSVRYIPKSSDLSLPDEDLVPGLTLSTVEHDTTRIAWHAIKLGDVSGTRSLVGSTLSTRSEKVLSLVWRKADNSRWMLTYTGAQDIHLYGLGLWLNSTSVEMGESFKEGLLEAKNDRGTGLSWLSGRSPLSLKHGATLLTVESSTRPALDLNRSEAVASDFEFTDPSEYTFTVQYDKLVSDHRSRLEVSPNPAKAGTSLRIESIGRRISSLHIVDARGRVTQLSSHNSEIAIGKLPESLPVGIYALQGRYVDGQTFEQRILVSK